MKTRLRFSQRKGFALVATLSLMILLTLIAVGLLTLSTVTVRAGGREEAMATARANARLALMIALGELQKSLGPDQAASAPAAAVMDGAQRPHLTGAWKGSLHWDPTPGGSAASFYTDKKKQFSRWLISTANPDDAKSFELPKTALAAGTNAVRLVGPPGQTQLKDSQGVSTEVVAEKVSLGGTTPTGKYAYAVFDQSTGASIELGDISQTPAEEIASRTAPNRMRADMAGSDPATPGQNKLDNLRLSDKLYTLETSVLPVGTGNRDEIRKRFHDFTTSSVGLLTDTAKGGLKKDLTALLESTTFTSDQVIYPDAFKTGYGAPSWSYLQNHYNKYKAITNTTGAPRYTPTTTEDLSIPRSGSTGVRDLPDKERLIPVVAKCQLVFSLVTHEIFNVQGRREWWNANGIPKDSTYYRVVHLAYDPVITLYNPYDVALDLSKIRLRVWDPPVVFRLQKFERNSDPATGLPVGRPNSYAKQAYFRGNPSDGDWAGLAQFQIDNQNEVNARKCFTLILADGGPSALDSKLKLEPGEVKVFSPRVEDTWTWNNETSGGMGLAGATFFDFDQGKKFANQDNRTFQSGGLGKWGVECAPGWDFKAGLQTDHLATAFNPLRSIQTKYDFEATREDGFVTLRKHDLVEAEIKPMVRLPGNASAQFQIDILAAATDVGTVPSTQDLAGDTSNTGVKMDTLRSFQFTFKTTEPAEEISEDPANPIIKSGPKTAESLQQLDGDNEKAGKYPFAMLELSARNTKDSLTDSKPWLHNNFVVEGAKQNTSTYGLTHQGYDLRLRKMNGSVDSIPNGIQIDSTSKRGYLGASGSASTGSSFVTMNHIPTAPAASLGDLISSNLVASALMPRVVHPLGNSHAHPLVPSNQVSKNMIVDHSYLLNDALWDGYFFSSCADYGTSPKMKDVLKGVLDGTKPAYNTRLIPATTPGDADALATKVAALAGDQRAKQMAKYVAINGAFNVNSTSVDAWRAVLSSLRDREIHGLKLGSSSGPSAAALEDTTYTSSGATPLARTSKPLANPATTGPLRWSAFNSLTDTQIATLAQKIVEEIKARGKEDGAPSLTLGEFVNRRLDTSGKLHTEAGLLQTAIDKTPDINASAHTQDSTAVNSTSNVRRTGLENPKALEGNSAEGVPSVITQGDLMTALAPIVTVRGDTFKIRTYGEALASNGSITARAWCEAIVQRVPDYVDPADAPEIATASLTSQANKDFGRQFRIVSFKQLSEDEL